MKKIITIILVLLFLDKATGQVDSPVSFFDEVTDYENSLIMPYLNFFSLPREQVYTHFNKSCYLPGDDIWFKCYVFNPKKKLPSLITNNLIVEIYYPNGKLLDQKILFVNQGVADNVIHLGANSPAGKYTFRAYTSWMRNYDELTQATTYLTVVGQTEMDTLKEEGIKYDVQFLPESGTLLEGYLNKVGIKAINPNGKGVKLSGDIIDQKGTIVKSFELNHLGMGSMLINAFPDSKFSCRVNLPDGRKAFYSFPSTETKGVIAQVSQFRNKIMIKISTNRQTLLEREQLFYLMIHDNGKVVQITSFRLSPGKTDCLFTYNREDLLNGVNCFTIFNGNYEPVAERLFYVSNSSILGKVKFDPLIKRDTIAIIATTFNPEGNPTKANLSFSVLPEGTASNIFSNNLLAEVLLKSGLSGNIENPAYYFEESDPVRQNDLDNLLLTQGWRKYSWKEILDTVPRELKYDFEKGYTLNGQVRSVLGNKPLQNCQISLFSMENRIYEVVETDSLGNFTFPNYYISGLSNIFISALNQRGKDWNMDIISTLNPVYSADSIIAKPNNNYLQIPVIDTFPVQLLSGDILLDEIKIVAKKREQPTTSKLYGAFNGKTVEITEKKYTKYANIEDLLNKEFNVTRVFFPLDSLSQVGGGYVLSINRGLNSIHCQGGALVIVDDLPLSNSLDLLNFNISEIESMTVDKTGFGIGVRGANGAIIVKTRTSMHYENQSSTKMIKVKGYSNPVAYYTPKYDFEPPNPFYMKYATVFWDPNVVTDSTGIDTVKFKIPMGLNSVVVRVEGMAEDGTVFLENWKIDKSGLPNN